MSTGALGVHNNTSIVSTRRRRWNMRAAAGKLLPKSRTAWCGSKIITTGGMVDIKRSESGAYYHGLASCSSVWNCPVCASRIASERREILGDALARWSGSVAMMTITLQHDRDDDLAELLTDIKDVWRRLKTGRWWQSIRDEFELAAYVTSTEVTWGAAAGWHPHLHVLLFSRLPEHKFDRARFQSVIFDKYIGMLTKKSRFALDSYGIHVRIGDKKAGDYISKYGLEWEITGNTTKIGRGGMSPFELLGAYADNPSNNGWAGLLFVRYAFAFAGSNQLTWSRDAQKVLGIGKYRTDDEIAADDEPESERIMTITYTQYKRILKANKAVDVLEIADSGSAWDVWQYLQDELGIIPERWQAEMIMQLAEIAF